jgi:hypothetical protein
MLYQFQCIACDNLHEEAFPVSEWDKRMTKDDRLKRRRCENCGELKLYRYIGKMPEVLGGTNGYVSMERYWNRRPEERKRREDQLRQESERGRRFKNEVIERQKKGEQIGPKLKE